MDRSLEWHLWSPDEIVAALPDLLAEVDTHLAEFPEEHREKNRAAVESLRQDLPAAAQVREGARSRELVTLGFALDVLGRRAARDAELARALRLFQAAHEVFRGGNPLLRAAKPMRQTLENALRALLTHEIGRVRRGETTLAALRGRAHGLVSAAWGGVPPQLALRLDELMLGELERIRAAAEADAALHDRLVRENLEAVLALEIPTRLEPVRQRWEELAAGPAQGARPPRPAGRRPERISTLVPPAVWAGLQQAVARGDAQALGHALEEVEEDLGINLRLRLDAKPEYREPVAELRAGGGPDPAFVEARGLLLRRDAEALPALGDLHYRRSANTIAKEWYAYALTLFGRPTDIHDVIELLEAAIASENFRLERGWTAHWNLATALRRLPSRAAEALDVLLPVLEVDAHPAEVFDLCLLWAIEQDREDVLAGLCLRARHHEAHLLAALHEARTLTPGAAAPGFRDHFRRVNRILRDPDRVFPDPRERLTFDELDRLTRDFVEASLIVAGIEWFRQRVSYGQERHVFKNWECAAALHDETGDRGAAWRCRQQSWRATLHTRNVDPRRKAQALRGLLGWAHRHGFRAEAWHVLRRSWQDAGMAEADARVWEERLGTAGSAPGDADRDGVPPPAVASDRRPDAPAPRRLAPARPGRRGGDGGAGGTPVAVLLDWENVKLSLAELLDELSEARAEPLRARLGAADLAARLLDAAARYGWPRQRWAVADWDRPAFEGDQRAVRRVGFWPDIAGGGKFNASDHVLREKIHVVLREHPDIQVFVIATGDGDFHETIKTLQREGKHVILWSTRRALSQAYGDSLRGPDRIQVEWLEDLVFGAEFAA